MPAARSAVAPIAGAFPARVTTFVTALLAAVLPALVEAARDHHDEDGEGCYRLVVTVDDRTALEQDQSTVLVYDREGTLLRGQSLIPSGVEL